MKSSRRSTSFWLCFFVFICIIPGILLYVAATAADDQEEKLLGTLSSSFESSGPGTIADNSGDPGGKSYGAYQFASTYDEPKEFFEWCQSSSDAYYRSIGDRLSEAYYDGTPGYGKKFDSAWKALASEDGDGFMRVQRNYARRSYYEPVVRKVESTIKGFKISNYSIALRNVFWSRAVQHGVDGATDIFATAFDALGGFANQPESQLIDAIYAESGALTSGKSNKMTGPTAEKYGIDGMTLSHYYGCSGDIQLGVYTRLRINEPAKAQVMLADYGYADAPMGDGAYRLQTADNSKLAAVAGSSSATLNTVADSDKQRFQFTYHASGYYTIDNVSSGKRLAANSGEVKLAAPGTSNNQFWALKSVKSGFSLKNRSTGQYLSVSESAAGGKLVMSDTAMQWQLSLAGAGWSLDGGYYPSYSNALPEGSSGFPFRGTLRCSYPITSVKVAVLNADGKNAFTPATASPNATSYDLSKLDSAVAFSKLSAGSYTMVITAKSDAPNDGTYTVKSAFYVTNGGYVLTFDPNGGTCSTAKRNISAGQVYGTLPTAKKDGYTFKGWYTAKSGGSKVTANSIAPASDVTLYARYTKNYTYTFLDYDGTVFMEGKLASGSEIPLPDEDPVRPSTKTYYYTFSSWEGYTDGMKITEDVTFTPKFKSHKLSELEEIVTDTYTVSGNRLRTIPTNTTVEELMGNLRPAERLTILKGDKAASGLVGTGMTVAYTKDDEITQTLTIVVTGDLNGDGECDLTDMVKLRAHLLGRSYVSGPYLQAADFNGDGKCTLTDMVQCQAVQLGQATITPR